MWCLLFISHLVLPQCLCSPSGHLGQCPYLGQATEEQLWYSLLGWNFSLLAPLLLVDTANLLIWCDLSFLYCGTTPPGMQITPAQFIVCSDSVLIIFPPVICYDACYVHICTQQQISQFSFLIFYTGSIDMRSTYAPNACFVYPLDLNYPRRPSLLPLSHLQSYPSLQNTQFLTRLHNSPISRLKAPFTFIPGHCTAKKDKLKFKGATSRVSASYGLMAWKRHSLEGGSSCFWCFLWNSFKDT